MTRSFLFIGFMACAMVICTSCVKDSVNLPTSYLMKPGTDETHHPIIGLSKMPAVTPSLPAMPEDFNVLPPSPKTPSSISVAQFGASTENPDNTKAFNDAIDQCAAKGISTLSVPKGVYRFMDDKPLKFAKLSDFTFDGQGSSFVFLHKGAHFMVIDYCERVVFKDFSIDWDWDMDPLASTVKLETVHPSGDYVDLFFVDYDSFPGKDISLLSLVELDPSTMSVGLEDGRCLNFRSPKNEWLSPKLLRVYADDKVECMKKVHFGSMKPGHLFRLLHRQMGIGAVIMGNNVDLTLSRVNVYSTPGPAIVAWGDQRHWQLLDTKVVKLPGSKRPISSTSDHFDIHQSQGYFKMERCEFGFGFDDGINISGPGTGLGSRGGDNAIMTSRIFNLDPYHVGDAIEIRNDDYSPTGFTSKIKGIKTVNAEKGIHEFSFDGILPVQRGQCFILFNKRYNVSNIIIRDCYFHDNQARGMLLHGDRILVENNRFFHNQLGAIHITTGYTLTDWTEGQGASDITIRNNVFDTVNPQGAYSSEKYPAIKIYAFVKTDPSEEKTSYGLFKNILIDNNKFINIPGAMAYVCSANNIAIRNNIVDINRSRRNNLPYCGSIVAACSSDIFVEGNRWFNTSYTGVPEIISGTGVTGLYYQNNQIIDRSPNAGSKK